MHDGTNASLQLHTFVAAFSLPTASTTATCVHVLKELPIAACSSSTSSMLTKTDIPFLGHPNAVRQPAHQRPPRHPTNGLFSNQPRPFPTNSGIFSWQPTASPDRAHHIFARQRHLLFATTGITQQSASYFLSPTAFSSQHMATRDQAHHISAPTATSL